MADLSLFVQALKQLPTYDANTGGYNWRLPKSALIAVDSQSDITGALSSMFGYSGTFSIKEDAHYLTLVFQLLGIGIVLQSFAAVWA